MKQRVITIVITDGNDFCIFEGERLCNRLMWDEFLGSIAVITHPMLGAEGCQIPPYSRLVHVDDYISSRQRYWTRKKDPPPEAAPTESDFAEVVAPDVPLETCNLAPLCCREKGHPGNCDDIPF